ncbi:BatA domain-containing protein [Sphingobium sp. CR2-8]|uniref:BatA domain-containing protein n=1 Tax=Sphingobium sp. CR2-8 TaxID=1306534 RepID=UPI002DB681BF|nr:BatA domain-containing protein [Sphingobium sp. CR2-8]MEC3911379.1 BatA domain-containing protein [Sphingobium sp. CR2-8]
MSMGLLFPAALVALFALVVPLVIHIARKSEQRPTDFAALRWLRQKPRPRSRLRFDEWPLLLVRLALLTLAALWLAQPVLFGAADREPYVAIVPGAQFDAAAFENDRAHWIAPGFPPIDAPRPTGVLPIASLIRQIDAELPTGTPLTIITPAVIDGADADRLHLSHKANWRITSGAMPPAGNRTVPPPALSVRFDADHRGGLRYLRAAAFAWQPAGRAGDIETAAPDAPMPNRQRILVWLVGGSLPDSVLRWVKEGGTLLAANDVRLPGDRPAVPVWRDDLGAPLAEGGTLGKGRMLRFARVLSPAQMPVLLDADFPDQFRTLLRPVASPTRVTASDYRPLTGARSYDQPPLSLQDWLGILIAVLLVVERWMATRRSRSVAP